MITTIAATLIAASSAVVAAGAAALAVASRLRGPAETPLQALRRAVVQRGGGVGEE